MCDNFGSESLPAHLARWGRASFTGSSDPRWGFQGMASVGGGFAHPEPDAIFGTTMTLASKIASRSDGILLYGLVPPKSDSTPQALQETARLQTERISRLPVDGVVVYDIQDEASRTRVERPFPFLRTCDGESWSADHLTGLEVPKIVYRAVGKYSRTDLEGFLDRSASRGNLAVFVGAASRDQPVTMGMDQAYALAAGRPCRIPLGGVAIPERHASKADEHLRVFDKIRKGCSFFVSQGVYDVEAARNFLSDYHYHGRETGQALAPVIFTLTPCGSIKTLEFMKWLGIGIPRWLKNDLLHAHDILEQSVELSVRNWLELRSFARAKGIPIGCNVESVAIRKAEVEASLELMNRVAETIR